MWINELADRLPELNPYRGRPIMVICYSGVRSRYACSMLAHSGFDRLYNAPGMMFWHDAQYEVVPGKPTANFPEC